MCPPSSKVSSVTAKHTVKVDITTSTNGNSTTSKVDENANANNKSKSWPPQPQNPCNIWRWMEVIFGCLIYFPALPFVICQIIGCTAWEWIDLHSINLIALATWFNTKTSPYVQWLVKHPKDGFIVPTTLWLGVVLPCLFWHEFQHAKEFGFHWHRAAVYNLVRIGPMYMHFMYVYVLCHKEAHCYGKLFASPYHRVLGGAYNWWIGLFHGVLPGTFVYSHINNHHKYDNGKLDVYSTGGFPRDNFFWFLRYVGVWFCYALNLSTIVQFLKEGKNWLALKTVFGTCYYIAFCAFFYVQAPVFAAACLLYPLVEANILLAMVNFAWHLFIDPEDHDNDYCNSMTILEGLNFTLREEYHVVHHQYAGIHWSRHQSMYEKHLDDYKRKRATLFYKCNIFELWGMAVFRDYNALAERFVQLETDPAKRLSQVQVAQMLKERLQCTSVQY